MLDFIGITFEGQIPYTRICPMCEQRKNNNDFRQTACGYYVYICKECEFEKHKISTYLRGNFLHSDIAKALKRKIANKPTLNDKWNELMLRKRPHKPV
jgi:hypothetical protein